MKKFKKLIAVVLTVILSLSVMSVVAFASTTDHLSERMTVLGSIWKTVNIMPTTQALLSIMTLGIMLKTAFLIGTIQALPSITVQHIMS